MKTLTENPASETSVDIHAALENGELLRRRELSRMVRGALLRLFGGLRGWWLERRVAG